jgi:hypothetical protein
MTEEKTNLQWMQLQNENEALKMQIRHEKTRARMSSEDRLWAIFWRVGGLILIILIGSIAYVNAVDSEKQNQVFQNAIKNGQDPLRVKCTMEGVNTSVVCRKLVGAKDSD